MCAVLKDPLPNFVDTDIFLRIALMTRQFLLLTRLNKSRINPKNLDDSKKKRKKKKEKKEVYTKLVQRL